MSERKWWTNLLIGASNISIYPPPHHRPQCIIGRGQESAWDAAGKRIERACKRVVP